METFGGYKRSSGDENFTLTLIPEKRMMKKDKSSQT